MVDFLANPRSILTKIQMAGVHTRTLKAMWGIYCMEAEYVYRECGGLCFVLQLQAHCSGVPLALVIYLGKPGPVAHPTHSPLYYSAQPTAVYWPMFVIAILASIVASQSIVTGETHYYYYYPLFLPRGKVRLQTSCSYRMPESNPLMDSPDSKAQSTGALCSVLIPPSPAWAYACYILEHPSLSKLSGVQNSEYESRVFLISPKRKTFPLSVSCLYPQFLYLQLLVLPSMGF